MRFAPITAGVLAALALPALVPAVHAQTFPSKQVTFVVPFPPGGSTDRVTRLIARKFSESVGQSAMVENRPGATGAAVAQSVLNAPQDGRSVFVSHVGIVAMDPHPHRKMAYDPVKVSARSRPSSPSRA